jgi:hypothetical protein
MCQVFASQLARRSEAKPRYLIWLDGGAGNAYYRTLF